MIVVVLCRQRWRIGFNADFNRVTVVTYYTYDCTPQQLIEKYKTS